MADHVAGVEAPSTTYVENWNCPDMGIICCDKNANHAFSLQPTPSQSRINARELLYFKSTAMIQTVSKRMKIAPLGPVSPTVKLLSLPLR